MTNRIVGAALLSAAVMVPAALPAQAARQVPTRASMPAASPSPAVREMATELQRIQTRLQAVHNQVMQDGELRTAQEAFMRDVKTAMQRVDPGLDALATRVQNMQQQAAAAQQRGDRQALQQLQQQMGPIQERFLRAQQQVLQQPAIAARARTLEATLHQRMLRVEPETDRLIERGKSLQARLIQMQMQQSGRAAPRN